MSGLNRVQLIGNLGQDPEVRTLQNGGRFVTLSIATSETWKDNRSGERRERTEWHKVVVFNERLGETIEKYLVKGSKVFLEGTLRSRKWRDQSGADRYTTEIHISPYNGQIIFMPDGRTHADATGGDNASRWPDRGGAGSGRGDDDLDDEI